MFSVLATCGLLLIAVAAVMYFADSDGLSGRMPAQVPPRRFAVYPLVAGAVLVLIGVTDLMTR